MKQIQFETSKVFGVFVKLPDGTKAWKNERYYIMRLPKAINLPNENYKILGFVSELTDEQKEGVVDKSKFYNIYLDYVKGAYVEHLSLQKSFASLLTSLNVLLANPYGDYSVAHKRHIVNGNWQTAQQHVGNWILLTCNK